MSSDLKMTLERFAMAQVAMTLPVETLLADRDAKLAEAAKERRRSALRLNPRRSAVGRLFFSGRKGEEKKPIPYMGVELWDRDTVGSDDFLGESVTDAEGRFEILYDPDDAGPLDKPDLQLRVVDPLDSAPNGTKPLLFLLDGPDDQEGEVYDFGDLFVPFYDYRPDLPLPHVLTFGEGNARLDALPQSYTVGRKLALARVAREVLGVRLTHYATGESDLAKIQADYRGTTGYTPAVRLGGGASEDEETVYKLLNGSAPALFTVDPEGLLHVVHSWQRYELDGTHYLPDVDAALTYEGPGGALRLESITFRERLEGRPEAGAPLAPPKVYRPGDPGWGQACHDFLCNEYLHGQVYNHLARAHFNTEQWALAAFRNLRRSPVRELLAHHLGGVMVINTEGESAIFGPDGIITQCSALNERSLVQAIVDHTDYDWYGFAPRAPMNEHHRFAKVANLYWEILGGYVASFFEAHLPLILRSWGEVQGFCRDAVRHSVPYRPWPIPEGHRHFDPREIARPDAPRVEFDGALRTLSVFAPEGEPTHEHVEHLMQVCRYAIYHATFVHSWVNDTTDVLEESYTPYGPVNRASPKELTDHISVNLALSQTRYGTLLGNEEGEISVDLIARILERLEDFEALGYDPRQIRSQINI